MYDYIEKEKTIKPLRQDIYKKVNGYEIPVNIYTPCINNEKNKYAVINIHGGGWGAAFKKEEPWNGDWMRHNSRQFAENGYYAFEITYRSINSPDVTLPDIISDARDAMRYCVTKLLPEFGIEKTVLIGDSAGGHLALCIAFSDEEVLYPHAVIACNPVSDCVNTKWTGGIENAEERKKASPYHLAKNTQTKFLIIHGNADKCVDYDDSLRLNAHLKKIGCECDLITLDGAEHAFILYGWKTAPEKVSEYMDIVLEYIDKITK